MVHIGSWGLPDFGITEKISDWRGIPRDTTTGGSQNIGTPYTNNYVSTQPTQNAYAGSTISSGSSGGSVSGTGTGGGVPTTQQPIPQPQQSSGPSPEDIYRQQEISNIDNKWNSYFSGLDQLMGGLPGQADLLKESANIQAGQQVSDLTASTQENQAALGKQQVQAETGQVKTLKDISNNIRNLMQAGNTYLGSRGAGDSSAVNQYAYALTKLGSQQRGDVMTQTRQIVDNINDRLSKVGNVFTQEKNRIESELSQQVNGIAQWLSTQQEQIKQAKLQGGLDKSADIQGLTSNLYNIAVQKATQLQNAYQERMGALQTWALNNSTSLKEAQSKLQDAGSFVAPQQTYQNISGTPQIDQAGNMNVQYGGGFQQFSDEEKRRLGLA
jgi:hypothetical protein